MGNLMELERQAVEADKAMVLRIHRDRLWEKPGMAYLRSKSRTN